MIPAPLKIGCDIPAAFSNSNSRFFQISPGDAQTIHRSATVTVTSTGVQLFSINTKRLCGIITNNSANDLSLFLAETVSGNASIILKANGGTMIFGKATDIPYFGFIYGTTPFDSVIQIVEINEP